MAPPRTHGVLDACCGCGGNAVAFLRHPATAAVVAVDTNAMRLAATRCNAAVYGYPDAAAACWRHGAVPVTADAPALLLLHASVPALLHKVAALLAATTKPATPATETARDADWDWLVGLDHVVGAARIAAAGGGVALDVLCPRRCCTATIPIHAGFFAPPWGGPSYDDAAGFDAVAGITMDGVPYPALMATAADLLPHTLHYLPRHTDVDGLRRALPAPLQPALDLCLPRLAGRRRPTALLAAITTPPPIH